MLNNRYPQKLYKLILNNLFHRKAFLLQMMPKNSICAEIGVWIGNFSKEILNVVHPNKLYLIDPYKYESGHMYKEALYGGRIGSQEKMDEVYNNVKRRFELEIKAGQILLLRKYSNEATKNFNDEYFDWIYIDGNHQYEYVMQDLHNYYRKVKKGGFITGDDYTTGGWWQGGVKKAVDEFLLKGLIKKVVIKNNQFILRKY